MPDHLVLGISRIESVFLIMYGFREKSRAIDLSVFACPIVYFNELRGRLEKNHSDV